MRRSSVRPRRSVDDLVEQPEGVQGTARVGDVVGGHMGVNLSRAEARVAEEPLDHPDLYARRVFWHGNCCMFQSLRSTTRKRNRNAQIA